jgi:hypothetical protein
LKPRADALPGIEAYILEVVGLSLRHQADAAVFPTSATPVTMSSPFPSLCTEGSMIGVEPSAFATIASSPMVSRKFTMRAAKWPPNNYLDEITSPHQRSSPVKNRMRGNLHVRVFRPSPSLSFTP